MFTDIVGFTDLMSNDESKALNILQEKIKTVQSEINDCNGVYVKDIGDGTLSFFESATKAVDCAVKIQDSLKPVIENKTTIIITQRISAIRLVDRIIVLDEGELVESGSHDELLALNGIYSRIYNSQLHLNESNLLHNDLRGAE